MKKVGVSKEEKQLSYYKFFERDLAEVPQEKLDILNKGASKIPAVPFEKRNLYFYRKKIKKEYNYVSNLLLKSEVV